MEETTIPVILAKGTALVTAALIAARGVPQEKRTLGGSEKVGQGVSDPDWLFRSNDSKLELTKEPVRVTSRGLASPAELFSKQNSLLPPSGIEEVDVVVCGGAAAGLSAAACLQHEGLSVIVIEKNESVGDIWRSRYHRLNLHDIIQEVNLPFFPMPLNYPTYATRTQFADYLDAYQKVMNIDVRTLHVVDHASKNSEGLWEIHVRDVLAERKTKGQEQQHPPKVFRCRHFVMGNGIYNDPLIPDIKNRSLFKGLQVHSSRYTNASELKLIGKKVLVVGWGNSGSEISVDLCEHGALPTIVVRSHQCVIPRFTMQAFQTMVYTHLIPLSKIPFGWLFGIPFLFGGDLLFKIVTRLYFGNIEKLGFKQTNLGPILRFITTGKPPMMDVGTIQCVMDGKLKVTNKIITELTENSVVYQDGTTENFHAIVWATGYQVLQGHKHIFNAEMGEKIGLNSDVMTRIKKMPNGKQHPSVQGLWSIWGRLQMIRDVAPLMARLILANTPNRQDMHPRPFTKTWLWFIFKHLATLLMLWIAYKRWKK